MENRFRKAFAIFMIILLSVVFIFLGYTIGNLQKQVDERDSIIEEKTEREEELREDYDNLIGSLNNLFDKSSLTDNGEFDVVKFIRSYNTMKDSIGNLKWRLNLIQKNYGIKVKHTEKKGTSYIEIIGSEKVDSALVLLPYYRNRLKEDKDGSWTIALTGDEYKEVKSKYDEALGKNEQLSVKYNNLIKDYNKLVKQYDSKVKFFRDLLNEFEKKGLVKIDSIGEEIEYTY